MYIQTDYSNLNTENHSYGLHVVFCCSLARDCFAHILQGYSTGARAIRWLPQNQWISPGEYGSYESKSRKIKWIHNKTTYNWTRAYFLSFIFINYNFCVINECKHGKTVTVTDRSPVFMQLCHWHGPDDLYVLGHDLFSTGAVYMRLGNTERRFAKGIT